MRIELFNPGHFPMIKKWWKGHEHPEVPIEILPDIGIISYGKDGKPLAVGFLYGANSAPVGWIEWITTNPDCTPFESYKGVSIVIEFLSMEAEKNGINMLLSTCRQKSLGRVLEKNGFAQTDESVSHYLKLIPQ
jgi:hypothetical protein